jgi:TolB-like protein/Tfp pilus assembly protein PilF
MSLFKELKRRNVFRVGIAYVVGTWLLIQVADILLEAFEAPAWTLRFIIIALAIGFPVALFFAWAFELTPEGIKREHEVDRTASITPTTGKKLNNAIVVLLVLAVAWLLYDKFSTGTQPAAPATAHNEPAQNAVSNAPTPSVSRQSIAVLPFDNRSREEDDAFFVEGIHDDLLTNLARIGSLKVISRTSVGKYLNTEKTIPEIAAELGVATIMEGAVQRSGNTVRINVQLIDAQTDEHLWAEIFDRELTADNLFAIQTEISERIAEALKATLSPEEQERISDRPTENLAAYNAFTRGRQLIASRNTNELQQARKDFDRAVELDPDFALAWVGVADTAMLLSNYGTLPVQEYLAIGDEAARRALSLNDQLGEAHLALAQVLTRKEQNEAAEAEYRLAIDLSPNYATAYQWYADFITLWPARWRESLELTRKAVELDPLSSILQLEIAEKLSVLGRIDEAEQQLNRLSELDPNFAGTYTMMGWVQQQLGQFDQEIEWRQRSLEKDPGNVGARVDIAFAYANLGADDEFATVRQEIEAIDPDSWRLGMLDMLENIYQGNYPAAIEAGRWVNRQLGNPPSFQGFFSFVHLMAGDYRAALDAYYLEEPRFLDRQQWAGAIQQLTNRGCEIGWLLLRTGEPAKGQALVEQSLRYLETELPTYTEHADRFPADACYMALGDEDQALKAFETRVAHGHIGFWWVESSIPWNEPLRGTPRFEAALQQVRDRVATQRARLEGGMDQASR